MIHYSCDRCQRAINPQEEIRYVVRIEVQLAMGDDGEISVDLGDEQLAQWEELLDDLEVNAEEAHEAFDECSRSGKNFDLCGNCYREYIANPLAVEPAANIEFSDN